MARFNNAFMNDAQDNKFQSRYNYLLDLLDQGYIVEKMIGNKMSRVEVSPENGLNISYDGENVLSIDPTTGQLVLGSSELSLGDLAYLDTVEEANLGTTIIQGGYIKTDLLTADNIQTGTFYADLVNIKSSSGTDRVEIVGTGINGYLSDVLRVQLEYDRLEFHRAGSSIGNIRTEYVNQSWGGSILGDCLFIESAGNSIAFNAASGSTAPSLVVAPTWVDAPVFASEAINIGQTDPKKWSIYTDSTDDTLYIEESGGSGLSLTSSGLSIDGQINMVGDAANVVFKATSGNTTPELIWLNSSDVEIGRIWLDPTSGKLGLRYGVGGSHQEFMTSLGGQFSGTLDVIGASNADAYVISSGGGTGTNGAPTGKYPVSAYQDYGWNFTVQNVTSGAFKVMLADRTTELFKVTKDGHWVGSTSNTWITARRIGLGVAANSTYTVDAGTGYIRGGRFYGAYYTGSGAAGLSTVIVAKDLSGNTRYFNFTGGILDNVS